MSVSDNKVFNISPRETISGLSPYQPGKPIEELAREIGIAPEKIVKLASNENPMGPGDAVLQSIASQLPELARYPDGNGYSLKQALCNKFSINHTQITLGNGSSDILEFIVKAYVNPGDEVIYSQHAFAIYGLVSRIQGADCISVPAKNYGHDLDAMASAVTDRTRIIFVTNPNNPTGTWLTKTEISEFLAKVPSDIIVLLDEAYFEYVEEDQYANGLDFLEQYPNLLVTRTFSKAYGLASLRVGYGVSHPDIADHMNRVRPPFNVNSLALAAAEAALMDSAYVEKSCELNRDGMAYLTREFDRLCLPYIPSVGNFVSFMIPEAIGIAAASVNEKLLMKGVIARPVANYEMPDYLRVSIGLKHENEIFIKALEDILKGID